MNSFEKMTAFNKANPEAKEVYRKMQHWHGVWSGTGQNKEFKIYWQPAIFVNAR